MGRGEGGKRERISYIGQQARTDDNGNPIKVSASTRRTVPRRGGKQRGAYLARQASKMARGSEQKAFNEINEAVGKIEDANLKRLAGQQIAEMISARTSGNTKKARDRYAKVWSKLVDAAGRNISSNPTTIEDYRKVWDVLPKIERWQKTYARAQRHS